MKPRTRERRARPSSTINNGARSTVPTRLLLTCVIAAGTILLVSAAPCLAAARECNATEMSSALEPPASPSGARADELFGIRGDIGSDEGRGHRSAGEETLWIFDADFEDLLGDNAGWLSLDMSGTLEVVNYWHKDTIRINGFEHLGDSTWWCGTYNDCWRQPRGYGNDWLCSLAREFPLSEWSDSDDTVTFEFDQRYAMELSYDYGYTDVSTDGGETWTTLWTQTNAGFIGTPGISSDWDSTYPSGGGHMALDLSEFAGLDIFVRYRFESDGAYSSEDQYDNGTHSVLDGAWQLDNFTLSVNDTVQWYDDCESAGSNGWVHDNIPGAGQTGVVFERVFEPEMVGSWCEWPREHWWMAALDSLTGTMTDGQNSWLISPPIDISGATSLIGQWEASHDLSRPSEDKIELWLAADDSEECVQDPALGFVYWWFLPLDGEYWNRWTDDWSNFAGPDWLAINWRLLNDYPSSYHTTGFMIDRQRVGVPVGGPPTRWEYYVWDRFHDTFDISEALSDTTASIKISDGDGILSAFLVVSSDGGSAWESFPLIDESPEDDWWLAPLPVGHIAPSTEIWYYFEATDGAGNVRTHPRNAPDAYYEFSILPIKGSVSDPCILLVDKHGRTTLDQDRVARHESEYFYREALDILGFEYDVFDVNVPSGSIMSGGPDTAGMKYYDTQIWFTNEFHYHTLRATDQRDLISWLSQAGEGKERNLLLTGNYIGYELIEVGRETLGFYTDWLATEYIQNRPGTHADTMPIVRDAAGDFDFMTFDNRLCHLWDDGCFHASSFDVVQPDPAAEGAELVAEYLTTDMTAWPAGVAYTDTALGYRTVNLGFGIEFMVGELGRGVHYGSGAPDRVDLMANIMEYFGRTPTATPTGVEGEPIFTNRLDYARPNPFNPVTTIDFSLAVDGRATIRVFNAAGRVVRTLVDRDVEAGEHHVVWDGTTDAGQRAASGVYFLKMETAGHTDPFRATRKLMLLK